MVSTTQNASTYLTFDLTDYVDDPASAGSFVLDYQLTASGAAPGTINIDYIGTVADNAITTANLIAWLAATAVKGFTVTDPAAGWHELDVSSIASDTFANDYAVFRITATTSDTWVVGTGTYGGTSGATLTISAPRGTVISLQ